MELLRYPGLVFLLFYVKLISLSTCFFLPIKRSHFAFTHINYKIVQGVSLYLCIFERPIFGTYYNFVNN